MTLPLPGVVRAPRRVSRRAARTALLAAGALLATLAALLLLAGPASAHATLEGSNPADGARLTTSPAVVTLRFDEQVGVGALGYLHVTNSSGTRVDTAPAGHPGGNPAEISVPLEPRLPDGTYLTSYRVISADSHPVSGTIRFVVGNGPLSSVTPSGSIATSSSSSGAYLDIARWISYSGFALLGGGWLLLTVWGAGRDDRRARGIVWAGWGATLLGAVLELLLDGPYSAGESAAHLADWSLLAATLHDDYGQLHSARILLLGLIAVLLGRALQPRERTRTDDAFWPLGLGLAFTFSASGHPKTTDPAWLSIGVDMAHLCAIALWAGGLAVVSLALLPRRDPDELREVLPVFSRVAFASVVAIAASGTYAAWRGLGSWRALYDTEWGLLLAAKIGCFLGLLALANLARRIVQRRVRRPVVAYAMPAGFVPPAEPDLDEVSVEQLRRGVLVELVVAGVVLALAAVLVGQPRGADALAATPRHSVVATAELGSGRTATVTVQPGVHGSVGVEVALSSPAQSVTATAALPARQLGPIPVPLKASSHSLYSAAAVDLPVAGAWQLNLVVTTSTFDAVTAQVRIPLS